MTPLPVARHVQHGHLTPQAYVAVLAQLRTAGGTHAPRVHQLCFPRSGPRVADRSAEEGVEERGLADVGAAEESDFGDRGVGEFAPFVGRPESDGSMGGEELRGVGQLGGIGGERVPVVLKRGWRGSSDGIGSRTGLLKGQDLGAEGETVFTETGGAECGAHDQVERVYMYGNRRKCKEFVAGSC